MSQQNEGSNETSAALGPLNQIGSIAFVFFCGPYLYQASIEAVRAFTRANYGFEGTFVSYFWAFMVAVGGYALAKFVIFLVLTFGVFGISQGSGR
ncbi:MAG: hypothetical protein AAF251_11330 [Pseudomonadota bacterium]